MNESSKWFHVDHCDVAEFLYTIELLINWIITLQINDDMCKQRYLCEMAADPDTYSPVFPVFAKPLSKYNSISLALLSKQNYHNLPS